MPTIQVENYNTVLEFKNRKYLLEEKSKEAADEHTSREYPANDGSESTSKLFLILGSNQQSKIDGYGHWDC